MTDISETLLAKSDQINASDLVGAPITVTIVEAIVKKGEQQPVELRTAETPGRAYRPSKSMRRIIAEAWGKDSSAYVGRALTLYRNPTIKYGGKEVGGIEISAMSHIDQALSIPLAVGRGRSRTFNIEALPPPQQQAPDVPALIEACAGDTESLRRLWTDMRAKGAPEDVLNLIANAVPPQTMTEQPELGESA